MSEAVGWLIAGLALIIVELMTGTFYLLIFGLAAMVASAAAYIGVPLTGQCVAAAVAALAGVVVIRRRRHALQGSGSVALDLGQTATFEAWTDEPARQARVRYRGAPWDAEVEGTVSLASGAALEVKEVVGTRLKVAPRHP